MGTQWPIGVNTVRTYLEGSLLSAIFLSITGSSDFSFAGIISFLHSLTGGIFLSSVLLFYISYFSLEVSSTSKVSATTFRWLLSTFFSELQIGTSSFLFVSTWMPKGILNSKYYKTLVIIIPTSFLKTVLPVGPLYSTSVLSLGSVSSFPFFNTGPSTLYFQDYAPIAEGSSFFQVFPLPVNNINKKTIITRQCDQ